MNFRAKLDTKTEEYIEAIRHELESLEEAKFTGNRSFKLNFREGGIANMNVQMEKSVKL